MSKESPRWWHDRTLLALLGLFVLLAPLVTYRIYASDEIQYFAYTRSLFFDGDLNFENEYLYFYNSDQTKFRNIYEDLYLKREPLTNLPLNVAPIGTGLLWMPSYALAHVVALGANALGLNVDTRGYTGPYIFAICMTSYIFGCIGLLLCYDLAKRVFGRRVSAVAVVIAWLATPLIFYTVIAPPWSHATSLLTVTLFLWYWYRTRSPEGRRPWQWALLGALAGLMMLVREQDALFMVVPFVEAVAAVITRIRGRAGAGNPHEPVARTSDPEPANTYPEDRPVRAIVSWAVGLAIMGIVAAIVFIPQLIAYRVITGRFGPSQVVTGKFTLTSPNALSVLFSLEHGLIPWTPVIVLSLAGLALLWRRDRVLTAALAAAFLLQVYIAGSFLTWQSAGSFGQRRFINSTLIFVLGLAMLITWVLAHGVPRWVVGIVAALFVAWNGGLLMQYALWCSSQRQGLDWATVLKGQLEIPFRAASLLWDYLFNRATFYRRTTQC